MAVRFLEKTGLGKGAERRQAVSRSEELKSLPIMLKVKRCKGERAENLTAKTINY